MSDAYETSIPMMLDGFSSRFMELRVRPSEKVFPVDYDDYCRLLPHRDHKQAEKCLVHVAPDVSFLSVWFRFVSFLVVEKVFVLIVEQHVLIRLKPLAGIPEHSSASTAPCMEAANYLGGNLQFNL